jgi:hypothetical protein
MSNANGSGEQSRTNAVESGRIGGAPRQPWIASGSTNSTAHFTMRRFVGGRGLALAGSCSTLIVTPPTVIAPDRALVPV